MSIPLESQKRDSVLLSAFNNHGHGHNTPESSRRHSLISNSNRSMSVTSLTSSSNESLANENGSSSNNSNNNTNISSISLNKYHQPSSLEKFQQQSTERSMRRFTSNNGTATPNNLNSYNSFITNNNNNNNSMILPPISSFDNLVRAAEKQYNINHSYKNININNNNNNTNVPSNLQINTTNNNQIFSSPTASQSDISLSHTPINKNIKNNNKYIPSASSSSSSSSSSSTQSSPLIQSVDNNKLLNQESTSPVPNNNINTRKISKPRRKKQCPTCLNYYANLSTHKSTHLTPEDRPHRCTFCNRGFARNNDLIRHKKRHWKDNEINSNMTEHDKLISLHRIKGTFKCPFNSTLIQLDMEMYPYKSKPLVFETSNCHSTGVFSRCDTYKNHLKALHFEYPPGTKKKDRSIVPGRCRNCGTKFNNVDLWLNDHVGKQCGYSFH